MWDWGPRYAKKRSAAWCAVCTARCADCLTRCTDRYAYAHLVSKTARVLSLRVAQHAAYLRGMRIAARAPFFEKRAHAFFEGRVACLVGRLWTLVIFDDPARWAFGVRDSMQVT